MNNEKTIRFLTILECCLSCFLLYDWTKGAEATRNQARIRSKHNKNPVMDQFFDTATISRTNLKRTLIKHYTNLFGLDVGKNVILGGRWLAARAYFSLF